MGVAASCASPWADGAAESRPRLLRSQLTRQERVSRGLGVPRRGRAEPGAGAAGTRRGGIIWASFDNGVDNNNSNNNSSS